MVRTMKDVESDAWVRDALMQGYAVLHGKTIYPTPRPGQVRIHNSTETNIIDFRGEFGERGIYVCQEGSEQPYNASAAEVEAWLYVSGPTQPETKREAYERVVKLEASKPPVGTSKESFLVVLLRALDERSGAPSVLEVRETAARLRQRR